MKRLFPLALIMCCTFFACKKNEYGNNNNNNTNPVDSNEMKYVINGIADKTIAYDDSVVIPLSIVRSSGTQQKITLSLAGLPAGATAKFDPESGIPDFASILTIKMKNPEGGNFNLKLTGSAGNTAKVYDMVLKVTPEPADGCVSKVTGTYINVYSSTPNSTEDCNVWATGTKNKIGVSSKSIGDVYCNLDCNTQKITIPRQKTSNQFYEMDGSGSYTATGIELTIKTYDIGWPTPWLTEHHTMTRK